MYEQSLAIHGELGNRYGIAMSLTNMGSEAVNQGDYPAARALLEESLAIHRELGDRSGIALSLSNLGHVALNQGDHPAGRALYEESMAISLEIGQRSGIPYSLEGLAAVVASLHDSLRPPASGVPPSDREPRSVRRYRQMNGPAMTGA